MRVTKQKILMEDTQQIGKDWIMGPCPPAVQVPIGTSPIELFASQHAVEPCIHAEFKEV
jgi:hypothetical protein